MPQTIELPDGQRLEFPDGMAQAEIADAIDRQFYQKPAASSGPEIEASLIQAPAQSSEELAARNFYGEAQAIGQMPTRSHSSFWENATHPIWEFAPRATAQEAQDFIDALKQYGEQRLTPGTGGKVTAGIQNAVADALDSLTSPLGIATLGLGTLPVTMGRIVSGAFAAHMTSTLPGQTKLAVDAIKAGDQEAAARHITGGLLTGAFAGIAGKHALKPKEIVQAGEKVGTATAAAVNETLPKPTEEAPVRPPETPKPVVPVETPPVVETPAREPVAQQAVPIETVPRGTQEPISVGPGAASPVEFEQRVRSLETPPPDRPPSVALEAGEPEINVSRKAHDYNLFNRVNSPQAVFGSGKLGESAQAAWQKMALSEFTMRESIARDSEQFVKNLVGNLPREFRKEGGKAFFEVLDGAGPDEIEARFAGKPGGQQVAASARALKQRMEEIRTTIRDVKREQYGKYLDGLDDAVLNDIYRDNIGSEVPSSKPQKVDALRLDSYPDDWGIADGSYIPHLFFGGWRVSVMRTGAEHPSFVTRAQTPQEAKARIREMVKGDPELASAKFQVEQETVIPTDMVRLFDKKFFTLVKEMKARTGLSQQEIRDAQRGIIGRESTKKKWFGSLQERQGFEGYEKNLKRVLTAYFSGFHRWRVLSQLQNEVTPLIEKVKTEGRPNAALRLETLMENLWGKPARSSLEFDAALQRIPGLKDYVQPLALDRWTRFIRNVAAIGHLSTLRFAVVNRLQPLQGLYPIVGEKIMLRAKQLQSSNEGRQLLDQHGVAFDASQYSEAGTRGKVSRIRERLSGERRNQELGFLAMYLHGTERGLPPAEAGKYAKLRGQLMTQFTPLVVDTPQFMEGPIAQTVFQYRRFTVKQLELIGQMAANKNVSGITRLIGVLALTGGLSYFLRQSYQDSETKLRVRKTLEDELGEDGADAVFYGLPGLLNADLSGSLLLGEQPRGNVFETVGRVATGPAVSSAIAIGSVLATEDREAQSALDKALTAAKRVPALKQLAEAVAALEGDTDVLTPDGEVKYRRTLHDALMAVGAFRSANEANTQLAIEGIMELKKETAQLKNAYYVGFQNGDTDKVLKEITSFNERWPEATITQAELNKYVRSRRGGSEKTDMDRIQGRKYKALAE